MLIRCPTCATRYELSPDDVPDGRVLRCAECRDAWAHRAAPAHHGGPEIVAQARSSRVPNGPLPPQQRRRARARPFRLPAGAAASVLVTALVGLGLAAVAEKARVVAAFPPSEAVFATMGVPVNLSGLAFDGLRSTVVAGDGPTVLTLEGRITNLRAGRTAVPPLLLAVRDKSRRDLYHWTAPAPKDELAPGETVLFRGRLAAPPPDGQDLAVSFVEPVPERRRVAGVGPGQG